MTEKKDMVNNPPHYTSGKYEVIDVIDDMALHWDAEIAFELGNTIKYIARYKLKSKPLEDLKKAQFYLAHAIKLIEKKEKENE